MILKSIFIAFSCVFFSIEKQAVAQNTVRNSSADFNITFTNRTYATQYFHEDSGLTVIGSNYYCAVNDSDHIFFNQSLDGTPPLPNQYGLILKMDNQNTTYCSSSKVIYATGHLSSYMNYGSGNYSFNLMAAHQLNGSSPVLNTITCVSVYCGTSTCNAHNEIAICLDPTDPSHVHFSYWIGTDGDVEHLYLYKPGNGFNMSQQYHTYGFNWIMNNTLQWTFDGNVVATANVSGNTSAPYPYEFLNIRLIQRPNNAATYNGDEYLSVGYVSFNASNMIASNSTNNNSQGGKPMMSFAYSQFSKISISSILILTVLSIIS